MFNLKKVIINVMLIIMIIMAMSNCFGDIIINEFEVTPGEESVNVTVSAKDETNGMAEHPYRVTVIKGEEEIHNSDWIGENKEEFNIDSEHAIGDGFHVTNYPYGFTRLDNGWLIHGAKRYNQSLKCSELILYKSIDNGENWSTLGYFYSSQYMFSEYALVADGNNLDVLVSNYNTLYYAKLNPTTQNYSNIGGYFKVLYQSTTENIYVRNISMIRGTENNIHVSWTGDTHYYACSVDDGQTWSNKENVIVGTGSFTSVAKGELTLVNNMPTVVFCVSELGQTYSKVFSAKRVNGYWSNNGQVSDIRYFNSLCVTKNGELLVSSSDGYTYLLKSHNNGTTWIKKRIGDLYHTRNSTVAANEKGEVFIVFHQIINDVYHMRLVKEIGDESWQFLMLNDAVGYTSLPAMLKNNYEFSIPLIGFMKDQQTIKYFLQGNVYKNESTEKLTIDTLIPNTEYTVKAEYQDSKGVIETRTETLHTKAKVPELQITRKDRSLLVTDNSNNPSDTEYKFYVNGSYVSKYGLLTDVNTDEWYTLNNKSLLIKGLDAGIEYTITAKAKNNTSVETTLTAEIKEKTKGSIVLDQYDTISTTDSLSFTIKAHDDAFDLHESPYLLELLQGESVVHTQNISADSETKIGTHTFDNLPLNTTYKARLTIINTIDDTKIIEKLVCTKAEKPALEVLEENINSHSIKVKFTDNNTMNTEYKVYLNDSYVNFYGEVDEGAEIWYRLSQDDVSSKYFILDNLSPDQLYSVKAVARNGLEIESEGSETLQIKTKRVAPEGKVEQVLGTVTEESIVLNWDKVLYATSYVVKVNEFEIDVNTNQLKLENGVVDGLTILPSTVYKISVAAKNDVKPTVTTEDFSLMTSFKTLMPKPVIPTLSVDLISNHSVSLSWNEVQNATKYYLEVDGHIIDVNLDNHYLHKGLVKGTQHAYRVKSFNKDGESNWTEVTILRTKQDAILTSNVTGVVKKSDESITLQWDAVNNATVYYIQKNNGKIYKNGSEEFVIFSGLKPETTYNLKVYAGDETKYMSTAILEVNETTHGLKTPIINHVPDEGMYKITWDEITDATGYEVIFNDDQNTLQIVTTNEFTTDKESIASLSTVKVRAINTSKLSSWSNVLTIVFPGDMPSIVKGVSAVSGMNHVLVTWEDTDANLYYDIEVNGAVIEPLERDEYLHDGLEAYNNYSYRVRAKNDLVHGLWSQILKVMTLPNKPVAPKSVMIKNTRSTATLSWDGIPSAEGYEVKVNESNQNIYKLGTQTEFTHRGIPLNTEQTYRLKTKNIVGESEWGNLIVNNSLRAVCKREELLDLGLTASNIDDFSKYTLQVTYNPDVLEVIDICGYTSKVELETGVIAGEDIEITRFEEVYVDGVKTGVITFKVNKPVEEGYSWSGIVNNIKFKPKLTGATYLTYTVMIEE